jgi:hypothetical protein
VSPEHHHSGIDVENKLYTYYISTVLIKVKIKKKKPTQLSTLNPQPHPRHSTPKGYPQKNGH